MSNLTAAEVGAKIRAYETGESNDLTGVHELTADRLRAQRAKREELHRAFEAGQAEAAKEREARLRADYLSVPGNAESGWQRDKARILADDAIGRMRAAQGGSLIAPHEFLA